MLTLQTGPIFFALIKEKPDLWGPFWIATTLVFLLAVTGNFTSYLASNEEH